MTGSSGLAKVQGVGEVLKKESMIGYPWPNATEYSSLLQNMQRYIEYISFSGNNYI
jgi:hypothetical protein